MCAGPGAGFCGKADGKTRAPPGHWFARPGTVRLGSGLGQPQVRVGMTWDHSGTNSGLSDRAIQPHRWLAIHANWQALAGALNRFPLSAKARRVSTCALRGSRFPSVMAPTDQPIKPCHRPAAWLQRVQP